MTDEAAFWAALAANPADDTGWLAFADRLADDDRPEAEFVRLFVAAGAGPGEAEFRSAWKRLRALRRALPGEWAAEFGRVWSARPLRFRVSGVQRLGTDPPRELFDRVLSIVSGELVSGALWVGQVASLPLAAGGTSAQRVWELTVSARSVERVSAGDELREVGLVWSGHRVADLGVAVPGPVRAAPAEPGAAPDPSA